MNRTERFYRIELLIKSRGGVNFETLMDELEVSRATLKRDLQYLRDRMDAPIVYDRFDNLYKFEGGASGAAPAHQLPGVWFSESEIHALLTMHQLIDGLDAGGVLGRHLQPLLDKLNGMLGTTSSESRELMKRVKIVNPARRPVPSRWFEAIGSALLKRKRLDIVYFTRAKQTESQREVSPQRLIHYRNTWYLDAWCHQSDGLRRFALDAVRSAKALEGGPRMSRSRPWRRSSMAATASSAARPSSGPRWCSRPRPPNGWRWRNGTPPDAEDPGRWQPGDAPALCGRHRAGHGHPAPRPAGPGGVAGGAGPPGGPAPARGRRPVPGGRRPMIVRDRPHGLALFFAMRGSVLPSILPALAVNVLFAGMVTVLHGVFLDHKIQVTTAPFSLIGLALAIFLGFATRRPMTATGRGASSGARWCTPAAAGRAG
jgi:predicted DNA-binding transcriptional regulator YafY